MQTPYGFLEVTNPSTTLTFTNTFKGNTGDCLVTKLGPGTWSIAGTTDNTRGRVQVEAGTVQLAKTSSSSTHALGGANALILNAGAVQITGTGGDQIYDPSSVQINGGTFDLNGQNEGFDILTSNSSSGVITNNLAGTTSTLTLGSNNGSSVFDGRLQDGAGALHLVKNGTGWLTLTGTNVLTGGTSVSNGRLIVSGSLTGSLTQVTGSGVLGGTGTTGDLALFGGKISPGSTATGAGIGKLTTAGLNMANGGTFAATIDTNFAMSSLAEIHGDLSLGVSVATLTLTDLGFDSAMANGSILTLMSYTGQWDGGIFSVNGVGTVDNHGAFAFGANTYELAYDATVDTSGVKYVALTVVPEPGVSSLLLGGLAFLGGWRRRRKADQFH